MNPYCWIPAKKDAWQIDSLFEFCECNKCKRRMVVSMGINGTVHHMGLGIICIDCLELDEEAWKEHPDVLARLKAWKAGEDISNFPQQRVWRQSEEIDERLFPLENTPVPGTITGTVLVEDKPIQSFTIGSNGEMYFTKLEEVVNYVKEGSYLAGEWRLGWAFPPIPPGFKLKVSYEYEV